MNMSSQRTSIKIRGEQEKINLNIKVVFIKETLSGLNKINFHGNRKADNHDDDFDSYTGNTVQAGDISIDKCCLLIIIFLLFRH